MARSIKSRRQRRRHHDGRRRNFGTTETAQSKQLQIVGPKPNAGLGFQQCAGHVLLTIHLHLTRRHFMQRSMKEQITRCGGKISRFLTIVLLVTILVVRPVTATTYISVEPIPNRDVVGENALAKIMTVGYPNLELWSNRLL